MGFARVARNNPNPWLFVDLDPQSPLPPAQQIAARIREAMEDGRLAPGDRLPGPALLARRYGVHASTVGRALLELRQEGRIRSYRSFGSFVAGADR